MFSPRSKFSRLTRLILLAILVAPAVVSATWNLFFRLYGPPGLASARSTSPAAARADAPPVERADELVRDDARRTCPCSELVNVELRVMTDGREYIGHAFLHTPARTVGFRTDEEDIGLMDYLNPLAPTYPGYIRDDTNMDYDYVTAFRACPETISRLERAIDERADWAYQVGDWSGGLNCSTWATTCLHAAGLPAPPGHCPNQLARYMTRRPITPANGKEQSP